MPPARCRWISFLQTDLSWQCVCACVCAALSFQGKGFAAALLQISLPRSCQPVQLLPGPLETRAPVCYPLGGGSL